MTHHALPRQRNRDLDDADEIAEMVRRFYVDVAQDSLLGPVFNDVAQVDWSEHIPKLVTFWCRALLAQPGYQGNPYRQHQQIHARHQFTDELFAQWLGLFRATVDEGWAGPKAEQAKVFASRVAEAHASQLRASTDGWVSADRIAMR